jgi:hypothetical protein
MQFKYVYVGLAVLSLACQVFSEECQAWSEKKELLQYLLDNKSNSLQASPACIDRAFGNLAGDKKYIGALVALLDFERSTQNDDHLIGRSSHYPAIGALDNFNAVPYLMDAIKEDESELVRTNAAEALDLVYTTCADAIVHMLGLEAMKPKVTVQERDRLRAAGKYIQENHAGRPCKGARPSNP